MDALFVPATFTSKKVQYDFWQVGLFGNTLRTWNSFDEILRSGYKGTLSMRYKGVAVKRNPDGSTSSLAGGWTKYSVPILDVESIIAQWVSEGAEKSLITFNESAPDDDLIVQGEVMHCDSEKMHMDKDGFGLYLRYSCKPMKMRDALKIDEHHAWRLEARLLLEHFLTPSSYDDINELLENFPRHTVEFSAYNNCVGNCRGRNAVIWEVRKY